MESINDADRPVGLASNDDDDDDDNESKNYEIFDCRSTIVCNCPIVYCM